MKIRIGNDFVFNWAIERGGLPEDLLSVLEKHLHLSVFGKRVELVEGVDYDITGNVIRIEVTPTIANIIGTYKAEFHYILPDNGLIDEDRKCAVDIDAFQIVAKTAQADDSTEFSMTSDMAIAFKGDKGNSAYQVWLDAGNTGTEEDYFAYLRQPAIDAGASIISQLAGGVEQLAYVKIKNEVVNGNFENGLIAPFSRNDGQGGESTLTINNSTPISGNYDIRLTITTPATAAGRPMLIGLQMAGNIGDKIYLHFYAKILSGMPGIRSIQNGAVSARIYAGDVVNGRNTRIIDVEGTSDSAGVIYFDSGSAVWDMQMDNFMRINLTETFGAGNEPTEEEMNLLLDIAGISYIDDEVVIPAQKIMQWQLALIRKNKNAIIALGGTII